MGRCSAGQESAQVLRHGLLAKTVALAAGIVLVACRLRNRQGVKRDVGRLTIRQPTSRRPSHRKAVATQPGRSIPMRRSVRTHERERENPGLHPGLVCVAPLGPQSRLQLDPERTSPFGAAITCSIGAEVHVPIRGRNHMIPFASQTHSRHWRWIPLSQRDIAYQPGATPRVGVAPTPRSERTPHGLFFSLMTRRGSSAGAIGVPIQVPIARHS